MSDDEQARDQLDVLRRRIEVLESELDRRRDGMSERGVFMQQVFEDAPIGMALVATDERIVEANQALCRMLGYTREELLELTVLDITHPDDLEVEAEHKGAMRDGSGGWFRVEKRYVRSDGTALTGRLSVSAIYGEDAQPQYFVGQLEDVTEERMAQTQLARASRLEAIGRLAGGVAHDFNNLLGVILAMSSFLVDGFDAADERREDVRSIEEAALRARDLTRKLLAIGRRQPSRGEPIDVHTIVRESAPLLQRLAGEQVEVEIDLRAEHGCVRIDANNFEQVLWNFASNVADATDGEGHFRISTRSIDLGPGEVVRLAPGRYLELRAQDDGGGIPADVADHVFDPFFTTKEIGKGTGLGLATVYGIVTQAGGSVRVESPEEGGARFIVLLPELEEAALSRSGPDTAVQQGTERVLLVEDDEALRRATTRILERGGYSVIAAADAAEAMRRIAAGVAVEAIVTDVVMPGLSGPEMVERIVAERGDLPVMFVSGYNKTVRSDLAQHPGFLVKPFTPTAFLDRLASVIRTHRDRNARTA